MANLKMFTLILFVIRDSNVYVLYVRHSSQSALTIEDIENED
jgi:hypothetical protein